MKLLLCQIALCVSLVSCSASLPEMDLRQYPKQLKARSIADEVVSGRYHLTKPVRVVFNRKVMTGPDGTQYVIYHRKGSPHSPEFAVLVNPKTWKGRYVP